VFFQSIAGIEIQKENKKEHYAHKSLFINYFFLLLLFFDWLLLSWARLTSFTLNRFIARLLLYFEIIITHSTMKAQTELLRDLDESAVNVAGKSNPGLRLLDACIEDLAYARYLLNSKRPEDQEIRNKVNWKDFPSGNSLLHYLVYSDLDAAVKLLIEYQVDLNITNKVFVALIVI
jgi:hypothetical protein